MFSSPMLRHIQPFRLTIPAVRLASPFASATHCRPFSSSTSPREPTLKDGRLNYWHPDPLPLVLSPSASDVVLLQRIPAVQEMLQRVQYPVDFDSLLELNQVVVGLENPGDLPTMYARMQPLFRDERHSEIITWLLRISQGLKAGRLAMSAGLVSTAFLGDPGMGKTTSLQCFTKLCPLLAPGVVPVYVSFAEVDSMFLEDENLLAKLLMTGLQSSGIDISEYAHVLHPRMGTIHEILENHKKVMMVILDEFEEVFRKYTEEREEVIRMVAAMAGDTTGLIGSAVCGSTTYLESLIKGTADQNAKACKNYPLAARGFNMNAGKLSPHHLPPCLPHAVDDVEGMLRTMASENVLRRGAERVGMSVEKAHEALHALAAALTFFLGSASRPVTKFLEGCASADEKAMTPFAPRSPEGEPLFAFETVVLDACKNANSKALDLVLQKARGGWWGKRDSAPEEESLAMMRQAGMSNWHEKVVTVTPDDVLNAVSKALEGPEADSLLVALGMTVAKPSRSVLRNQVIVSLRTLRNQGTIRLKDDGSIIHAVYPVSMYQLVGLDDRTLSERMSSLFSNLASTVRRRHSQTEKEKGGLLQEAKKGSTYGAASTIAGYISNALLHFFKL